MLQTIAEEHRAKDLKKLDLDKDSLPLERALVCSGALRVTPSSLMPCPDDNALLRKRKRIVSFWPIVHTDPENAVPEHTLFWKRVSGWRNPKTQPSRFHVDCKSAYFPKR